MAELDPDSYGAIQEGNKNLTQALFDGLSVRCRPNSNQPELIPDLRECGIYHICINGQAHRTPCDDGLVFNINRSMCSATGRCLLDYLPICRQSGTLLPHVHDCRHYFFCEPNQVDPILMACRGGDLFDQRTTRCVPGAQATCGNPPNDDDLENWPGTK